MGSIVNIQHDFSKEGEEATQKKKDGKYVETILELCEEYGIEPESAAKLLSKPLREKLKAEFEAMNMIRGRRKKSKLPID